MRNIAEEDRQSHAGWPERDVTSKLGSEILMLPALQVTGICCQDFWTAEAFSEAMT